MFSPTPEAMFCYQNLDGSSQEKFCVAFQTLVFNAKHLKMHNCRTELQISITLYSYEFKNMYCKAVTISCRRHSQMLKSRQ
jgi:hypothetical protein